MSGLNRRDFWQVASFVLFGGWLPSRTTVAEAAPAATPLVGAKSAASLYKALGVKPFINCRGTVTVIGGSIELPEVREAKALANQMHVQIDELMAAAGKRLAELTGAEWGMVSAGCSAAISHATAACIAGGNPDLHVRIPNLEGFAKDEVIIPNDSRTVYDAAIRAVGARVIEVDSLKALEQAIGPRTAMIYLRPNAQNEFEPMGCEAVARVAKPHGVPIFVDAAAEALTIPSVHLQRGATLVAYSGGKIIRGPQSAGLLLGRKDLVQAAWVHSAPHHGYARSMKVGREEVIGMLTAVESWANRDHAAEWKTWMARCDYLAERIGKIPGVKADVRREPGHRNNFNARVAFRWDPKALGITGAEVADILFESEPHIALGGDGGGGRRGRSAPADTGISINVSLMTPGDEKIVAERVVAVLSQKHTLKPPPAVAAPAGDVTGTWTVDIQYAAGKSTHRVSILQRGNTLTGTHQGDFTARELEGTIDGNRVTFSTAAAEFHGDSLEYAFTGTLSGDALSGTIDMGEYLNASWTARRQA